MFFKAIVIFVAFIISAILSVPAINYFLKSLNKEEVDSSDDIDLGLLPGEK